MAISYISSAASIGVDTVAMSTHTTGDYIIGIAWTSSATIPTLPGGWTSLGTATTASVASRIGYKVAASGAETTGTWTNSLIVSVDVYRGVTGVGTPTSGTGTSTSVGYPALTLSTLAGTSWVLRGAAHVTAGNMSATTPSGYTSRNAQNSSQVCDSNAGLTSNPILGSQTVNTSGAWQAWSLELSATVVTPTTGPGMLVMFR